MPRMPATAGAIRGMDVIDKISSVKTGTRMGMRDVPTQTVKILSVKIKR